MGRIYTVTFPPTTVSAAQDLLQIKGAAGKVLRIRKIWCGADDTTLPTSQQIKTRASYLPATVTDGSGGGTAAIGQHSAGDAAASFTALCNNTTKATTGGTAAIVHQAGNHLYNGDFRDFGDSGPTVGPTTSFVYELLSAASGTVNLSGGAEVEEIG